MEILKFRAKTTDDKNDPHRQNAFHPLVCHLIDVGAAAVERLPNGYVDLLTRQARRIFLQLEQNENGETVVKNTVIMCGYSLPQTVGRHEKETMTAFRASKMAAFSPLDSANHTHSGAIACHFCKRLTANEIVRKCLTGLMN